MLCHTVSSSGSFSGGLSTGLVGLGAPPSLGIGAPALNSLGHGIVPFSTASIPAPDYSRPSAGPPTDLHPSAYHPLPSFNPFGHPRPDELFYGGLRSNLPSSGSHFRPEENPLSLMPNRNLPMGMNSAYHERFSQAFK